MNSSQNDIFFMRLALAQAHESLLQGELPVGAVIVHNTSVVAQGHKSSSHNARIGHAELLALQEAAKKFSSCRDLTIYCTLEPCIMCMGAILNLRVGRVIFALEDPYGGACGIPFSHLPLRNREEFPTVSSGVCRDESIELMRNFFRNTGSVFWRNSGNPLVALCLGHDWNCSQ